MIRHVILDFDLTLVDSLRAITLGVNRLARHFGLKEVSEPEVRAVMHLECQAMWSGLWGRYDTAWHEFFITAMAGEEKKHLTLFPGAADLLRGLRKKGLGLGLATNRDRPWEALAAVGLAPYFDSAAGALEVARGKPAPDMLQLVMERLEATPEQTIFIGDAPSDMAAAARAGLRGVGILAGGGSSEELLAAGAWQIRAALTDLDDLWN